MKKFSFLFIVLFISLVACNNGETSVEETTKNKNQEEEVTYASFGDEITDENTLSSEEMLAKYKDLKAGDTIDIKFSGEIENVCQKKGCWMNVKLNDENSAFVRFKDYGFFMPFNSAESEVIVNGRAFISEVSVDELKHYAEDEEKSQEEIDAITEPEITFGFLADGVLIKE